MTIKSIANNITTRMSNILPELEELSKCATELEKSLATADLDDETKTFIMDLRRTLGHARVDFEYIQEFAEELQILKRK